MYTIVITKVVESTATTTRETYTNKGVALNAFILMSTYTPEAMSLVTSFVTLSLYEDDEIIRHYDNRIGIVIDMEDIML